MDHPILSNDAQAALWSGLLRTGFRPEGLYGVDDDNTLAESGVYNSHHDLKSCGETLLASLDADAGNVQKAAEAYEAADTASAKGFE